MVQNTSHWQIFVLGRIHHRSLPLCLCWHQDWISKIVGNCQIDRVSLQFTITSIKDTHTPALHTRGGHWERRTVSDVMAWPGKMFHRTTQEIWRLTSHSVSFSRLPSNKKPPSKIKKKKKKWSYSTEDFKIIFNEIEKSL